VDEAHAAGAKAMRCALPYLRELLALRSKRSSSGDSRPVRKPDGVLMIGHQLRTLIVQLAFEWDSAAKIRSFSVIV